MIADFSRRCHKIAIHLTLVRQMNYWTENIDRLICRCAEVPGRRSQKISRLMLKPASKCKQRFPCLKFPYLPLLYYFILFIAGFLAK